MRRFVCAWAVTSWGAGGPSRGAVGALASRPVFGFFFPSPAPHFSAVAQTILPARTTDRVITAMATAMAATKPRTPIAWIISVQHRRLLWDLLDVVAEVLHRALRSLTSDFRPPP